MTKKNQTQVGGLLRRIDAYSEHLQMIGLVITEWSSLEMRLSLTLWQLLDSADHGNAIFSSVINSRARVELVENVARLLPEKAIKNELFSVLTSIGKKAAQRNKIAHGSWGVPADETRQDNPFLSVASKDGSPPWQHIFTVKELRSIADEIRELEERLSSINEVLRLQRHPPVGVELDHINNLRSISPQYDAFLNKFL